MSKCFKSLISSSSKHNKSNKDEQDNFDAFLNLVGPLNELEIFSNSQTHGVSFANPQILKNHNSSPLLKFEDIYEIYFNDCDQPRKVF